ncbi:MAG: hybrid sensor histidine kinase/response regulator [Elusimicrobiales bacterium]|nr:hybrid sensor histidine kinase/response regulator [Elusimicrobiales bacterium]
MSRILIVDDNKTNLELLEAVLKESSYEVVSGSNGQEALEIARKQPPDLVISDILMPVMDGYELCMKWRADTQLRRIPFVFYTATYTNPKDQAYGLSLGADRFVVKPVKIEALEKLVQELLKAGPGETLPAPARDPVGEKEMLRGHSEVIFRKLQQKVVQLEAEVAARRTAEEALTRTAKALKEKNCELQDFIYIASHDLRGPLVNLQGFSGIIKKYCAELPGLLAAGPGSAGRLKELLNKKLPEASDYIASGVADMDRLLNGLLRMSRIWSAPMERGPVNMDVLAGELIKSMTFHFKEADAGVTCGELPPCFGDKAQLGQVFFSLLDNSVKYRDPARKLLINISGKCGAAGAVSYTVSDNGRGLSPAEEQGRVWDLFYRGAPILPAAGEGLGLTIAKRILERHGGSITAGSVPGGGAVFTVEMPGPEKKEAEAVPEGAARPDPVLPGG